MAVLPLPSKETRPITYGGELMAKSFVIWGGLAEYQAQLAQMPEALTVEAGHAVEGAVNGAYVAITGAYPVRTGNLRKGMRLTPVRRKGFVVAADVKNIAPHAILFERGTQARHYFTVNGVKHLTGRMPPGNIFIPRILKARRALTQSLKEMLVRRWGATVVTDDAG